MLLKFQFSSDKDLEVNYRKVYYMSVYVRRWLWICLLEPFQSPRRIYSMLMTSVSVLVIPSLNSEGFSLSRSRLTRFKNVFYLPLVSGYTQCFCKNYSLGTKDITTRRYAFNLGDKELYKQHLGNLGTQFIPGLRVKICKVNFLN